MVTLTRPFQGSLFPLPWEATGFPRSQPPGTTLCGYLPQEEGHLLDFWLPIPATPCGSEAVAWGLDREAHPPPRMMWVAVWGGSCWDPSQPPYLARILSPPPPACSSASSRGRRHKKEPRLLEPLLPWGRGPQDPHLVAIEEEKL